MREPESHEPQATVQQNVLLAQGLVGNEVAIQEASMEACHPAGLGMRALTWGVRLQFARGYQYRGVTTTEKSASLFLRDVDYIGCNVLTGRRCQGYYEEALHNHICNCVVQA